MRRKYVWLAEGMARSDFCGGFVRMKYLWAAEGLVRSDLRREYAEE